MYLTISTHIDAVLNQLDQDHFSEYKWLINNSGTIDPLYKRRYEEFWGLNGGGLSREYREIYFDALDAFDPNTGNIDDVAHQLFQVPVYNETYALKYSFYSKLVHTKDPSRPVYDSRISRFYFFEPPGTEYTFDFRLEKMNEFYRFLDEEYRRVLTQLALGPMMEIIKLTYNVEGISEVKLIDSILWAFVGSLQEGHLMNGNIQLI